MPSINTDFVKSFLYLVFIFLVTCLINSTSLSQSDWEQLFYDNFEDENTDGWNLRGLETNGYWQIYNDNGNYVIKGQGQNWAEPVVKYSWTDFSFKCRVKIINGGIHINYRLNDLGRYFLSFHQGGLSLFKHLGTQQPINLANHNENFIPNKWYTINIVGIDGNIRIFIDEKLKVNYTDVDWILAGSIAFEANPGSIFYVDDIEVLVFLRVNQIRDPSVVYLGNPFKTRYPDGSMWEFARNVWDMHAWNGKIYLGHGDLANNAGPIIIWYYDPILQKFIDDFTVDEEQIDRLREFNNCLYIPGSDATESWDFGNFYVNKGSGWKKFRTVPNEIHLMDICFFHDTLFVCGSNGIYSSVDSGLTWHNYANWGNELFIFNDRLFCGNRNPILRYDDSTFVQEYVNFLPDADWQSGGWIDNIVKFRNQLVFVRHFYPDGTPVTTFCTVFSDDKFNEDAFFSNKTIQDIIIHDDTLCILTSTKYGNEYLTEIFSTVDLQLWNTEVQIITPSFVQSFEYSTGSYYIAIGAERYPNMNSVRPVNICGDIYQIIPSLLENINFPSRPSTTYPTNKGYANSFSPTFIWTKAKNADKYILQYSPIKSFDEYTTVTVGGITDTSYSISNSLPEFSIWYWRVRAENNYGVSEYSTPASFMIYSSYQSPSKISVLTDTLSSAKIVYGNEGSFFDFEYPKGSGLTQFTQYYRNQIWVGAKTQSGTQVVVPLVHAFPWTPVSPFFSNQEYLGVKNTCQYSDENNDYTLGPGIKIKQNIYSWDNENFALLEFNLRSTGRKGKLSNLFWGMYLNLAPASALDWIGQPDDLVGYDNSYKLSYVYDNRPGNETYIGITSINKTPSSHQYWIQDGSYEPYTVQEKYEALARSYYQSSPISKNLYQILQSIGPFQLNTNDSVVIAVAIVWGKGLDKIRISCELAKNKYSQITTDVKNDNESITEQFELFQNYPNPFNPITTIKFSVPKSEYVTLKLFNILGEEIATLVSKHLNAGTYTKEWDATKFPSGIYLYTLKAGSYTDTKKLILLK